MKKTTLAKTFGIGLLAAGLTACSPDGTKGNNDENNKNEEVVNKEGGSEFAAEAKELHELFLENCTMNGCNEQKLKRHVGGADSVFRVETIEEHKRNNGLEELPAGYVLDKSAINYGSREALEYLNNAHFNNR